MEQSKVDHITAQQDRLESITEKGVLGTACSEVALMAQLMRVCGRGAAACLVVWPLLPAWVMLRSDPGLSGLCRVLPARLQQLHMICQTQSCSSRQLQAGHFSRER